jgi:hypothetical protein
MARSPRAPSLLSEIQASTALALAERERLDDAILKGIQIEVCLRVCSLRKKTGIDFEVNFYRTALDVNLPDNHQNITRAHIEEALNIRYITMAFRDSIQPNLSDKPESYTIKDGCAPAAAARLMGWDEASAAIDAMELRRVKTPKTSTSSKPPRL